MTIDDLIKFYGVKNDAELSRRLNLNKATISRWRKNGITEEYQAIYEVVTKGGVKAELPSYQHLMP